MATKPCPKCGGGPLCGSEAETERLDDHMTITEALHLVGQDIEDSDEELIQEEVTDE